MTSQAADIKRLSDYVTSRLENQAVCDALDEWVRSGKSPAGKIREDVFTTEFLCPVLREFFDKEVREVHQTDKEIEECLGTPGFQERPGFGFTPASKPACLFTKSLVVEPKFPTPWLKREKRNLPGYQACPDFAIKKPLLSSSVVGEVKLFPSGSPSHGIQELYNASRQALFYLGTLHTYESAMIVIADASHNYNFVRGLELLKDDLLNPFGSDTGIHLVTIKLR